MEYKLIYPRWGSAQIPWPEFLEKLKNNGYHGVEANLPQSQKEKKEIIGALKDVGMDFIGQHYETKEVNFNKHKESLKRHLYNLVDSEPLLINSHTGMDFFSFSQNVELIELALAIEEETGIKISHETHRSRFGFAPHICLSYLKELPFLQLTSDFAHWTCVAETLLGNQKEAVQTAIDRTLHIHARVGSTQSSQVIDPRDKRYIQELDQFKRWWSLMMKTAKDNDRDFVTFMPEHGPKPYNSYSPNSNTVLADQWEVNQFIKKALIETWEKLIN